MLPVYLLRVCHVLIPATCAPWVCVAASTRAGLCARVCVPGVTVCVCVCERLCVCDCACVRASVCMIVRVCVRDCVCVCSQIAGPFGASLQPTAEAVSQAQPAPAHTAKPIQHAAKPHEHTGKPGEHTGPLRGCPYHGCDLCVCASVHVCVCVCVRVRVSAGSEAHDSDPHAPHPRPRTQTRGGRRYAPLCVCVRVGACATPRLLLCP